MARTYLWMRALGQAGLPTSIALPSAGYLQLEETVKHDFWAATGFYRRVDDGTRVVVKINRREPLPGLPMRWAGRILCARETRAYRALADVSNVPAYIGTATDTGFVHAFIRGQPLRHDAAVPDSFFDELVMLIGKMADRGIAAVDTNKPQNILLGDDGRPYLIDFQISFDANAFWPRWVGGKILRILSRSDLYHIVKQKRRFRPDLLTEADRQILTRRLRVIRLHRTLTKPYFLLRRPLMRWLQSSGRVVSTGSD